MKLIEPRFPFYPPLEPAEIAAARGRAAIRRAAFRGRGVTYPEPRFEPLTGRRLARVARLAQVVIDLALAYKLRKESSHE